MNNANNDKVIALLREYPNMKRKRDVLKYEMEHPALVSDKEMLEAMSYLRGNGAGIHSGGVSDRTYYIAMHYKEKADALNNESRNDIAKRLLPLEREIERLEFYVKMLSEREQDVLRMLYFEGKKQQEAAKEMGMSTWTIRKCHSDAVNKLAEMYAFAEGEEQATS